MSGGSVADHDRLCEELEAYEATDVELHTLFPYLALKRAAERCGIDVSRPFITFARRRVATYRAHIAQVSGLVAHLNNIIEQEMSQ